MLSNWDESRAGGNTSVPSCCGKGLGIPKLAALSDVSRIGGGRFTLRVRESLTPRANKNVALAVRLLVSSRSTPALAIALREVCKFGSAVKIDGRIEGMGTTELPPSSDWKIWVATCPYATCSNAWTPFFSSARFTAASRYRSKKMPNPALRAHLSEGL